MRMGLNRIQKRRRLGSLLLAVTLLALVTGCNRLRTNNPTLQPSLQTIISPGSDGDTTGTGTGDPTVPNLPTTQTGDSQLPGGVPLALNLLSPQNGSVVSTPDVLVTGTATP